MIATLEHTLEQLFVQNNNDQTTATVGYDCKLIVGEDQIEIGCHRAIIQARSPDIIVSVSQSSTADVDDASILKISFPDDDAEAMSAIVQYCYTNTISTCQISTPQLADNLLLAVKKFGLDRDPLGILCKNILAALDVVQQSELTVDISDANALNILKLAVQLDLEWLRNEALNCMSNCDYDGVFESIKCLEESCSSILSDFEAVVRKADDVRTRQAPQLIQGISLRGCLGIVAAASVSVLLFRIQIENEVFVAFTNVCFCCMVAFFFL
eukprot:scaffold2995_cov140-Skeletonema_marinoi.AAC.31